MSGNSSVVLAAEDDESDALILNTAFRKAGVQHRLVIARDGREILDYFGSKDGEATRCTNPLPALIILDLKMPRMNGFDVLTWLATQSDLKEIPAIVLSSSPDQADAEKARRLGARDYLVKPHKFAELVNLVAQLDSQWLKGPVTSHTTTRENALTKIVLH
jgi:CheY-like chemotaxis protein